MPLMSLLLPWEVIERVIEHASDDINLLRSFSLTCRQLRPCSSSFVAQYFLLDSRDRVSDFCDFLLDNTELRTFIQSLNISPAEFRPFPLITMLPYLSTLVFTSRGHKEYKCIEDRPAIELHHTTINCYHSFGKRIRTLSFNHLSFRTSGDFFRLLLAFPMRTQLTCNDVAITSLKKEASAINIVRSKLSKQLRLQTLHVRIHL